MVSCCGPPMTKFPAVLLNVIELLSWLLSTMTELSTLPAKMMSAVPLLVGAPSGFQLVGSVQLPEPATPPSQVKAAARNGAVSARQMPAAARTILHFEERILNSPPGASAAKE